MRASSSPVKPGTRFARTLTLFVLMLTVVFSAMAYSSWTGAEPAPSPASLFAPRAEVRVTAVTVRKSIVNGSTRFYPLVTVEWPTCSGISRAIAGLEPSFYAGTQSKAQALIAPYAIGELTTVRIVDARPVVDRNDLFRIGHALFLSVFSLLCGLFTYVFFHASRASRKAKKL